METKIKRDLIALTLKCLKASISKDETRLMLTGVYHHPTLGQAVSTDGHRITFASIYFDDRLKGLIMGQDFTTVSKSDYVKVDMFSNAQLKTKNSMVFKIDKSHVDTSNKLFKSGQGEDKAFFLNNGTIYKGVEILTGLADKVLFVLNPYYLAPLVGYDYIVDYSGHLNPVRFNLGGKDLGLVNEQTYVVMPMKYEATKKE